MKIKTLKIYLLHWGPLCQSRLCFLCFTIKERISLPTYDDLTQFFTVCHCYIVTASGGIRYADVTS
jgi:hypothetical protein